MADEREALGEGAEHAAVAAADIDPVLGGHLEEVDTLGSIVVADEVRHEGPSQPQPSHL